MYSSIILTRVTYTYIIVDASGNTIVQATTEDNTLDVPDVIKSPFASYTYYNTLADAQAGTNPISSATTATIYVRYTTPSGALDLNGGTDYYIRTNGFYLYANNPTTLGIENSLSDPDDNTRKWTLNGNDAYQLTIKNTGNDKELTYNVSSGEAVPSLSETGSKVFLHQSTTGTYEVMAVTSGDYSSGYYSMGVASSTLKLYSSSNHPMGDAELQSNITTQPPCATPVITFNNATGQVTITCATDGATIHYTTNGNTPTTSSLSGPIPFPISATTTVKAIAVKANHDNSNVAERTIEKLVAPSLAFDDATQSVTITTNSTVTGASTVYAVGSTPTTGSLSAASVPLTETSTVNAMTIKDGYINSDITSLTFYQVATPTFSFNSATNQVTITSTDGATIYYSIGSGNTPAIGVNPYNGPITLTYEQSNQIIRAIAVKNGMIHSSTGDATYKLSCPMPSISFANTRSFLNESPFASNEVTITCTDAGATLYYTTDGSDPDPEHTDVGDPTKLYDPDDKPTLTDATTVKAIAVHAGYNNSDVATQTIARVATPTIQNNGSNAISITCATAGATIYYETLTTPEIGTAPIYTTPLREDVSGAPIYAIAVKEGMVNSAEGTGTITLKCEDPVISFTSGGYTITCDFPSTGVTIFYETADDDGTPATPNPTTSDYIASGDLISLVYDYFPITVTAIATSSGYDDSDPVTTYLPKDLQGEGTEGDPYLLERQEQIPLFVGKANDPATADKYYKVTATTLDFSSAGAITQAFSGTFDGNNCLITGLTHALFNTVDGGTVKNVMLDDVTISSGTNVGAICNEATGAARIYNCGVLGGTVRGSDYVGGLVGLLDGTARVINCFSYATITDGSNVGGIVGYNNVTTTAASINTMVMNCMFYGDITGGTAVSPVYGGTNIDNLNSGGLNTFNYYAYDKLKTATITDYNCALAVEERYLNRIEFYRLLLNSNKVLAAYYASTASVTVNPDDMLKWVLETADRQNASPKPYPILKAQGKYPSIINIDAEHAEQLTLVNGRPSEADRNKGGKIGTLSVTISAPSGWTNAPSGAKLLDANGNEITTTRTISLNRTDKDEARFNFNYDKVQLPFYNDYGTKNYTKNKVVTGWKITAITEVANDPYAAANYDYDKTYSSTPSYFDFPNYNFADRKSSQKDLYSVSGRVFSQGAYFDVPYGVTSITIEPYWGNAAYVADEYLDVVCKYEKTTRNNSSNRHDYVPQNVTQLDKHFPEREITIDGEVQTVYTSISDALATLSGSTVYDNAIVLVGNMHFIGVLSEGTKPFTLMSVDLDKDNEPDCSLIYGDNDRHTLSPLRFDFLNVPGAAQAQKPNGTGYLINAAIYRTKGWFEITNTAMMYFSQYEYENQGKSVTKSKAPLILLGGYIDQFVSTQSDTVTGKTIYIHVGSNVLINSFGLGTHGDGEKSSPHIPVSVTGGDYLEFYLSGTYNPGAHKKDDNAECYISGGRFGVLAGAAQEQIGYTNSANNGNVRWQIYEADVRDFYGGGCNDACPVQGNITTEIFNSHVTTFCGGPKFGNMATDKEVNTTAEGCTFGEFFGAGYGGNSYNRKKYYDKDDNPVDWSSKQNYYTNDRGKYFDGETTGSGGSGGTQYGYKGPGVATDFDYEYFVWTSGATGGRFYVKFASFSLATCNNVTSTLTNCTINKNFYGGGSLGKVSGTVTSTLDDCIVKGNVFGAGYSASIPKIPVRNAGFAAIPSFNSNSGMFEKGVKSDSTEYEWKHMDSYPSNNTAGILTDDGTYNIQTGTNVVTKVDISKTNLGSVSGHVTLTLKGNTEVGTFDGSGTLLSGGNVFGGGDESAVINAETPTNASTSVILQGNTHVGGNVYGGGNRGTVGGKSEVEIKNEP